MLYKIISGSVVAGRKMHRKGADVELSEQDGEHLKRMGIVVDATTEPEAEPETETDESPADEQPIKKRKKRGKR